MQRWWLLSCGSIAAGWLLSVTFLTCPPAQAQPAETQPADVSAEPATPEKAPPAEPAAIAEPVVAPAASAPADESPADSLRSNFANFLQFAIIGRFDYAQAHAKNLLDLPDVKTLSKEAADALVDMCDKRPTAIDTLIILVSNSTIGEEAGKILGIIRESYRQTRMNPVQIKKHIEMLTGTPTEQATGLERLIDSGEYAVPHMLNVLADQSAAAKALHPYVVRALPRLGKPAVNPLVIGLSIDNDVVRNYVADALGRLGYPQALAYLKRLADDPKANPATRKTAAESVRQIVVADPRVKEAPALLLFRELAEGYYAEADSLVPDRNQLRANVWVVDGQTIKPVDVPRQIFCMVMSMQASKASLALAKDQPQVLALWLAANFRRESLLGLDVQTAEAVTVDDPTQPEKFPRSIYFASQAGPACCELVLNRGLKDKDRPVVLGAIAGIAATAGAGAAIGADGRPSGLAEAIRFPDQLVRLRAALVLGRILPQQTFTGANEVVPVLVSAFTIDGQKNYLVIDPNQEMAEAIAGDLTKAGAKVIAAAKLELGLARAAEQASQLDGVFLASDMAGPGPVDAVRILGRDERFGLAPVVLYVKEGGMLISDQVVEADWRVGRVLVVEGKSPTEQLLAKLQQVNANYGYDPLTAENGVALSLEAALALQRIAAKESKVFDAGKKAEEALTKALNTHASEEVRIATTRVLASLNTPTSQAAIAAVALSDKQTPTLRIATFASLAESAQLLGNRLNEALTKELIAQARSEPNLDLRTAASKALGATINMPAELAVEAILNGAKGG